MEGLIFDMKRYAIHDGPGIRTTVFFKGCPLRCRWCHNPESQAGGQSMMHSVQKLDGHEFNADHTVGERITPQEVIRRVMRDRMFFDDSNGGVTFSGGEPLLQTDFLLECLKLAKEAGLHTTVDTAGAVALTPEMLDKICDLTDLFLYDVKTVDPERFSTWIGNGFDHVVANLKHIAKRGSHVLARIPVIPGVNNDPESISAISRFLNELGVRYVEMLPFHRTGSDKYERLGMQWGMGDAKSLTKKDLVPLKEQMARELPGVVFADDLREASKANNW